MKIYHTETQEDYDALMAELERQGCKWLSGQKPTEVTTNWKSYLSETCVGVNKKVVAYAKKNYYTLRYPDVSIIKYRAKVDEKMRFTKKNVLNLTDKWIENKTVSFQELQNQIKELDDTPEKVAVPKFVAEWYESQTSSGYNIRRMIEDLLNGSVSEEVVLIWLSRNYSKYGLRDRFDLLALIRINGYTIEPEKLYYIPLPHLETSDGIQQVLSQRKGDKNYFASRPNDKLKQQFTKEELEQVPEIYKSYAELIVEEEE